MSAPVSVDSFQRELARLVEIFAKNLAAYKSADYDEASLRQEFLNPFFRALGWDIENLAGHILQHREVEIESRTQVGGRQRRADYLFRTERRDRFVCEAKKPAEELRARYAFQAKRYAWNKGLPVALLTDFEELRIYVVGGRPYFDEPEVGLWKSYHFRDLPLHAQELWDLLSRDRVAGGSIEALLDSLPTKPTGKGKARQQWLIKPDRTRALDTEFLNFLDEARRELATDLLKHNDRGDLLEGTRLNEAVQHILDRLLFLRICEDRDIDTGLRLDSIVVTWRKNTGHDDEGRRAHQHPLELRDEPPAWYGASGVKAPRDSLWHAVVRHFRALDRRPPSHIPFFNGNLFKPHFSEELVVSDEWVAGFVNDLSADESPYLFSAIPVEILGTIYERFLGKIARPHGRGAVIEEKPEVRKAGGVYYTPRYIVEYIVGQTVGKLLDEIAGSSSSRRRQSAHNSAGAPSDDQRELASAATFREFERRSHALRILDPACGSGSFLLRAFERVCEHWQTRLTRHPEDRKPQLCWLDPDTSDVHLGVDLKRRILRETIHGVDLDPQAVEVTQLSLYLKMLENENRFTLARDRDLFGSDEALLPPLEENIKCGNSLIASDFSLVPDDLVRVHAFDWSVQFPAIMKAGGFDAVVGNPPWGADQPRESEAYFERCYRTAQNNVTDSYALFMERAVTLLRKGGRFSFIVPDTFLRKDGYRALREVFLTEYVVEEMVETGPVFSQVRDTWCLIFTLRREAPSKSSEIAHRKISRFVVAAEDRLQKFAKSDYDQVGSVAQQYWRTRPEMIVGYLSSPDAQALVCKIETHPRLGQLSDRFKISRGEEGSKFRLTRSEKSGFWMMIPENVHRYDLTDGMPISVASLAAGKVDGYYRHPKLWIVRIQKMRWPQRIVCAFDSRRNSGAMKTLQVVVSTSDDEVDLKYLQAILGSKLINFWCLNYLADDMNQTYLERIPIRQSDGSKHADLARHDRLVGLVDKMLALMPKLRAAKTEAERQTLQNAVTATDPQIDALVYELYGLTGEEIRLVEGHA
jgi:hypothetical protein